MNMHVTAAFLSAVALSGCGGGDGAEEDPLLLGAADGSLGDIPADYSVSYDEATDTVTFEDGTETVVLGRVQGFDGRRFRGYALIVGTQNIAMVADTASGDGSASVVLWPSQDIEGTRFARLSETRLPTGGTAAYAGDYAGLIVRDSGLDLGILLMLLHGDADLTADFRAGTISGVVTNRTAFNDPLNTFGDVVLAPADISEGAFAGVTTGGDGSGTFAGTALPGRYSGMFTGAAGQEVVGGAIIVHDTSAAGVVTEYGAFVAD